MTNYTDADRMRNFEGVLAGLFILVISVIIAVLVAAYGGSFIFPAVVFVIGAFVTFWYTWATGRWYDNTSAEDF